MADLLTLEGVAAGYGEATVIEDISFSLAEGKSLALLGRNGTGKSTLLQTILGLTRRSAGRIVLDGTDISRASPEKRAVLGVGWVPQERNIFPSLTVEENLTATARSGPWTLARVYEAFPRLKERRSNMGNQLSGGEQQMLAMGRALMLNPKILLLDEPLEGLAPVIVEELLRVIQRIVRDEGLSAILVEQNARQIRPMTDRAIILDHGAIVRRASSADLLADDHALDQHLGLAAV